MGSKRAECKLCSSRIVNYKKHRDDQKKRFGQTTADQADMRPYGILGANMGNLQV